MAVPAVSTRGRPACSPPKQTFETQIHMLGDTKADDFLTFDENQKKLAEAEGLVVPL